MYLQVLFHSEFVPSHPVCLSTVLGLLTYHNKTALCRYKCLVSIHPIVSLPNCVPSAAKSSRTYIGRTGLTGRHANVSMKVKTN